MLHCRIPIAIQWMFPTPLAILIFCAPESPWWLVRKGRLDEAARSVERLGRKSRLNAGETVAMMRRVIDLELSDKKPNILELFKGTDLYRTCIVCGVYLAQNLTGNLIANQAVYFFERELSITFPPMGKCANSSHRGRRVDQYCVRPRSDHLGPTDDFRHAVLDPHHVPWTTNHLPLGLCGQRHPTGGAWYCRLGWPLERREPGAGVLGSHRFCLVHFGPCTRVVGHYRRNLRHPSPTSDDRYGTCRILHH